MDARRFDLLARGVARLGTRRSLLRSTALAVAAGGTLASVSAARALDATGSTTPGVGGSDGTTVCPPSGRPERQVTGVAPFPAFIIGGICDKLDESVRYNLLDAGAEAPSGDPRGAATAVEVAESMTSIRVKLDDLLTKPHAVVVRAGGNDDGVLACGEIGGQLRGDALTIGLRERNGSGYTGVAKLAGADSQTNVDIFVAQDLFQTSGDWKGTTVVATVDINLREGPSESAKVVAVLGEGTTLTVTGDPTGNWLPVTNPATGDKGYVNADYVEVQETA